jgi:hypothetical protein
MGDQYQHDQGSNHCGEHYEEVTFVFPILDTTLDNVMNNIPPSIHHNFHGLNIEDLGSFLFEFNILCHSYN